MAVAVWTIPSVFHLARVPQPILTVDPVAHITTPVWHVGIYPKMIVRLLKSERRDRVRR